MVLIHIFHTQSDEDERQQRRMSIKAKEGERVDASGNGSNMARYGRFCCRQKICCRQEKYVRRFLQPGELAMEVEERYFRLDLPFPLLMPLNRVWKPNRMFSGSRSEKREESGKVGEEAEG